MEPDKPLSAYTHAQSLRLHSVFLKHMHIFSVVSML